MQSDFQRIVLNYDVCIETIYIYNIPGVRITTSLRFLGYPSPYRKKSFLCLVRKDNKKLDFFHISTVLLTYLTM